MSLYNLFKTFTNKSIQRIKKYQMYKLAQGSIERRLTADDMLSPGEINAARVYWEKYVKKFSPGSHIFYSSKNGVFDVRYVPEDVYYSCIDPYFNNWDKAKEMGDKNYFSLLFHDVRQPVTVLRKINNVLCDDNYHFIHIDKAYELCKMYEKIIFKPANSFGGEGILFWQAEDGDEKLMSIFNNLGSDIIVQQVLSQHAALNKLHSYSLNTVKIISLIFNDKVNILSSILRMGINGSKVDNASQGGISCGIQENGRLKPVSYTANGVKFEKHPQGAIFSNCIVPSFGKVQDMIVRLHERLCHFQLVSWDFAIAADGTPVLIEVNLGYNGVEVYQLNNGPLFGDMTEEILNKIFNV